MAALHWIKLAKVIRVVIHHHLCFQHALSQHVLQLFFTVKVLSQLLALGRDQRCLHLIYSNYLLHFVVNRHRFQDNHAKQDVSGHSIIFDKLCQLLDFAYSL